MDESPDVADDELDPEDLLWEDYFHNLPGMQEIFIFGRLEEIEESGWHSFRTKEALLAMVTTLMDVGILGFERRDYEDARAAELRAKWTKDVDLLEKPDQEWVTMVVASAVDEINLVRERENCGNCGSPFCEGPPKPPSAAN